MYQVPGFLPFAWSIVAVIGSAASRLGQHQLRLAKISYYLQSQLEPLIADWS
jgi:hypothetical protein